MGGAVAFDASGLAETVERARALLDDGDVMAARMLAAAGYDQAKVAGDFAARFGAADRLVAKARRLQGDALLIEARAKSRIADDYDAAQAAGAAARGRPKTLPDGNTSATAADLGLSAKDIFDARKLRDAERKAPGIVERAIAARIAAGLEPTRANLRAAVGTASATQAERGNNLYETPPEAMRALLALEGFLPAVWEPACGRGAIARQLEAAGHEVFLSDLVDYGTADRHGEVQDVGDFLLTKAGAVGCGEPFDLVTNPPYGAALNGFVAHALREHGPRKMALLLNLNFLAGFDDPDRCFAMDENPPARIRVFTRRLPMMHRDGWDGNEAASRMNTAWVVWERDAAGRYAGPTVLSRVDWKDFATREPLAPEAAPAPAGAGEARGIASPAIGCVLVWRQDYRQRPDSRLVAYLGTIEVGAVFPDKDGTCTWSFWLGTVHGPQKSARTVEKAKAAIEKMFFERTGLGCVVRPSANAQEAHHEGDRGGSAPGGAGSTKPHGERATKRPHGEPVEPRTKTPPSALSGISPSRGEIRGGGGR